MKTSRLILLAGLILGAASLVTAGPGPQFWVRGAAPRPAPGKIAPAKVAPASPSAAMACTGCLCGRKG